MVLLLSIVHAFGFDFSETEGQKVMAQVFIHAFNYSWHAKRRVIDTQQLTRTIPDVKTFDWKRVMFGVTTNQHFTEMIFKAAGFNTLSPEAAAAGWQTNACGEIRVSTLPLQVMEAPASHFVIGK